MNEINGINNSFVEGLAAKPVANNKELGKNEFLKLMIAQLNNQDPLSPQENGDFIAQLAQFSSVEGIENLNTSMGSMATSFRSSQALQASALVGRTVLTEIDSAMLQPGGQVSGMIDLQSSTSDLKVNIANEAGVLVNQISLGSKERGEIHFVWTGKDSEGNPLPAGKYKFEAMGSNSGVETQAGMALSANVDSVSIDKNRAITLNLSGIGTIPLDEVKQIM